VMQEIFFKKEKDCFDEIDPRKFNVFGFLHCFEEVLVAFMGRFSGKSIKKSNNVKLYKGKGCFFQEK
jgi:hypothetical protein